MILGEIALKEDLKAIFQRMAEQDAKIERLERGLSEYVRTREALKITGLSKTTLEVERNRSGTLIQYKKEGRTPLYLRSSLEAYNDRKAGRLREAS